MKRWDQASLVGTTTLLTASAGIPGSNATRAMAVGGVAVSASKTAGDDTEITANAV